MGVYLDKIYCKKCGKELNFSENIEAYDDHLFLCHKCKEKLEMVTKKDLAKYLADYVNQELEEGAYHADGGFFTDKGLFEQALEAFESTENIILLFYRVY